MDAWVWIVLAVVAAAVIVAFALVMLQRRRSRLQGRLGREYLRALEGERQGR